ncbi:hypothetical protein [Sphaerisporangium sp. TRM90804]|uniref:hypothetical protein n=1 Tax=Sphaerisporangium sp. TRM90804 TaxID=3031113 RepID=UPI0024470C83|nr:hypothetical protein [Sphaerisporangium sp. TRM90804]MDH2427491.1 hypothetical protein [Sphaerisporangium sp. TRM90804]
MYAWIWRRLPGGRAAKAACSAVLLVAAVLLLWFVVFPVVDGLLPLNDVAVGEAE